MKFLVIAALLVAVVSSSVIVRKRGLQDCGPAGSPISFAGDVLQDQTPVPGRLFLDLTTTTLIEATAEDNLQIRKVTTRTTDNYEVPCLNGIAGTCTIELCTAIATYPEYVCTLFPNDVACSCPLAASVYYNPSAYVTFTSEWLAIDGGVNGDYNTRTEVVANLGFANETILGCLDLQYTLVAI